MKSGSRSAGRAPKGLDWSRAGMAVEVSSTAASSPMHEGQPKKKRVRTGCLNCRRKHKKCDELKPNCSTCRNRNEVCEWPVQVGRFNKNSIVNFSVAEVGAAKKRKVSPEVHKVSEPDELRIRNYSNNLISTLSESEYSREGEGATPNSPDVSEPLTTSSHLGESRVSRADPPAGTEDAPIPQVLIPSLNASPQNSLFFPDDNFLMYNDLHDTLRDFMFSNASTSLEFQVNTPSFHNILNTPAELNEPLSNFNKFSGMKDVSNPKIDGVVDTDIDLTEEDRFHLLKNYIYEVAPWLDMFDTTKQFGSVVPDLARDSDALMNSIYAISSRQTENTTANYSRRTTMNLYRKALKSLIPTVNNSINIKIVTACVILCVFEMMSSSPHSWRRHLEGCAALFKASGIHGFSENYKRALFWCYARMDVDAAVIGENPTIIPSHEWLPKNVADERALFVGESADMYSNYSIYLCSKVLNLRAGADYDKRWESLWIELNDWYEKRPNEIKQVLEVDRTPFPLVLYTNGPAISANQVYHMAVILMMDSKPKGFRFNRYTKVRSSIWHAKQIVSISLHNPHHGCWNNALQPLWVAGKLLSGDKEQSIILDLLTKIEKATGWIMKFRAKDLQKYWSGEFV